MSETVRETFAQHSVFYEVSPYYVVLEERTHDAATTTRRIHAGFDVDLYGTRTSHGQWPSRGYLLACETLQDIVDVVRPHTSGSCSIEVIPFGATIILDAQRHFQPEGMLRIRITHQRGLDQPAGAPEEHALQEVIEQLNNLGVRKGRG